MLFEKSSALPSKGSLKEALFLTVWLRRQEAEVFRTRILAQGIVELSEKGAEKTVEVFKRYISAALPFMEKEQEETDKKLKEVMAREVQKGVIMFNAPLSNPLVARAKAMSLPDEFRQKLAAHKRIVEA